MTAMDYKSFVEKSTVTSDSDKTVSNYVTVPYDITFNMSTDKDTKPVVIPKGYKSGTRIIVQTEEGSQSFIFYINYKGIDYPVTLYSTQSEAEEDGWIFTMEGDVANISQVECEEEYQTLFRDSEGMFNEQYGFDVQKGKAFYSMGTGFLRYSLRVQVVGSNVEVRVQLGGDMNMVVFKMRPPMIKFIVNLGYVLGTAMGIKPNKREAGF